MEQQTNYQQPYIPYNPSYFLPPEKNPHYRRAERRNLSRIGWALVGYLIFTTIVQAGLIYGCQWLFPAYYETEAFSWILQLVPGYLLGFPFFWGLLSGMPKKAPERKKLGAENWIAFLAIAFFLMMAGGWIANILMTAIEAVRGVEIGNAIEEMITDSSPLMNLILVVIAAPIIEELMFRKLIIDRLAPYSETLAVVTCGLFFGLIHGNFYQFFYAALLGILFSVVYIKTGNILHTILMHMIINFTGSIIADFLTEMSSDLASAPTSINPWDIVSSLYSIAMMVLAVCGLILLIRKIKKLKLKKTGDRLLTLGSQFRLCWLNAGTIVLCVFCGLMFISSLFI